MVKIEHAVVIIRQFKTAGLTSAAELPDIFDLSLFPSLHTEPVETLLTLAHDSILVAGLSIKLRNRFLLMAGGTFFHVHDTTILKMRFYKNTKRARHDIT